MRWRKLGHVFVASGQNEWMLTHASNPVACHVGGDTFRIYFSSRDQSNRSSVGWIEIDLRAPQKILRIGDRPSLSPGPIGSFDDSGCSIGCIVADGDRQLMYYMGWNLGVTVPWRNSIGLAVSNDRGDVFERVGGAPILDRSNADPFSLSYPTVLRESARWRMWYGSHLRWGARTDDMIHVIKHAASRDGLAWERDGATVVGPQVASEYAFARPSVLHDGRYRMWYAYRGEAYRIGYAHSLDGVTWARSDGDAGIFIGPGEWDSEALAYPWVFDHGGERYMLYCGNGYGRTGFGLAMLEAP